MARSLGRARATSVSLPTAEELAIARNREAGWDSTIARRNLRARDGGYPMSTGDAVGAASLMERSRVVSPFSGLPTAASGGEFFEAVEFFGTDADGSGGLWDEYFDSEHMGYNYDNLADQFGAVPVTSGSGREPAQLSVVPTSTINPERPRTVAAGYDRSRQVLTVVFRDGTFYNYYDVSAREWQAFKQSKSKGRYIKRVLDYKDRGIASMASVPYYARESLYRIARTGQWAMDGQRSGQGDRLSPRINPTASRVRTKK